jgi:hypothetical protein
MRRAITKRLPACEYRQVRQQALSIVALKANSAEFLKRHKKYQDWRIEYVGIVPHMSAETRTLWEALQKRVEQQLGLKA